MAGVHSRAAILEWVWQEGCHAMAESCCSLSAVTAAAGSSESQATMRQTQERVDRVLLALDHVCEASTLEKAVKLVDGGHVERLTARATRRTAFRISSSRRGTHSQVYLTAGHHFCDCASFSMRLVNKGAKVSGAVYCKHTLAILLAQASGMCAEVEVDDVELGELLFSSNELAGDVELDTPRRSA